MSPLSLVDAGLYQQITKPEQVRHLFELGKDDRIHCDSKEDLLSNKKPHALSPPFLYSHLKSVPLQEFSVSFCPGARVDYLEVTASRCNQVLQFSFSISSFSLLAIPVTIALAPNALLLHVTYSTVLLSFRGPLLCRVTPMAIRDILEQMKKFTGLTSKEVSSNK